MLTQRAEDIPFDLRHWRYIAYQLIPRGMKEFETTSKEIVRNVLKMEDGASGPGSVNETTRSDSR
jgi:hypothetical protein